MSMLCESLKTPSTSPTEPEVTTVPRSISSVLDTDYDTCSWASTPRNSSPSYSMPGDLCMESPMSTTSSLMTADGLTFDVVTAACEILGSFLTNEVADLESRQKTAFDASQEPQISLPAYIERIRYYSQVTPETLICSVVLMRRVCKNNGIVLNKFNVHRLIVASSMLFAKFYDDDIDSNCRWARVAGVKKSEINTLEIEMLNLCQFDLRVSPEDYNELLVELMDFSRNPQESKSKSKITETPEPAKPRSSVKLFRSRLVQQTSTTTTTSHSEVERPSGLRRTKSILSFFQPHPQPHIHFQRVASPPLICTEKKHGIARWLHR